MSCRTASRCSSRKWCRGKAVRDGLIDIYATIYVERDSQKPIVLGKGGSRMKDIGTRSRGAIARLLGSPVYLDLHVKVAKEWQRDPKQLRRLGF